MHIKKVSFGGSPIDKANKALIMLHGRGANAADILSMAQYLNVKDFALLAPQATNNSWYPFSFLAPPRQNEPWLSSAISLIGELVSDINSAGIENNHIYFMGFSQGACLTLEYVARHAKKYGGVAAFTGGLVGDTIYASNYTGDFEQTPVFIGTSDPDPHVPVSRVHETENVLKTLHAAVSVKVYENMGHTISQNEIDTANEWVFR